MRPSLPKAPGGHTIRRRSAAQGCADAHTGSAPPEGGSDHLLVGSDMDAHRRLRRRYSDDIYTITQLFNTS